jgi:heme oxygenase
MSTVSDQAEAATSFASELRSATAASHSASEQSGFMSALVDGRAGRDGYAELVAQTYFVYESLERAADAMRGDAVAGAFVFDELTRLPAIERDLVFLRGPAWRDEIEPTAATARYVARLDEVGSHSSERFVAHHYTRYMGDLSGGQFIARAVRDAYQLEGNEGTEFFVFDGIADLAEFKDGYRRQLDRAPWDAAQRQTVIDEVLEAYRLNRELLAGLDPAVA